jgi:UDP-3-O-[3-hydroxymyristoyl] glucosamine N-acyltransferase
MKIVLVNSSARPSSFLDYNDSKVEDNITSNCLLSIFGESIVIRNLSILNSLYDIEKILVPKELKVLIPIIRCSFKFVIEEVDRVNYSKSITANMFEDSFNRSKSLVTYTQNKKSTNNSINQNHLILGSNNDIIFLPCNVIVKKGISNKNLEFQRFDYPWDFLEAIDYLLKSEVKLTNISPKAQIAKSSVIDGPCIIEEEVVIDDFVKIKGPTYIGKGSFIGMGSLIRNSILEYNTNVGFNCEIGKSYFAGNAKVSHHNVILDSLIGKNVWFGGYSGTANVLLTRENIHYIIDGKLKDTGKNHFGAVVSNNSSIGASVIIMPGRKIPPNSMIPAGTIYKK